MTDEVEVTPHELGVAAGRPSTKKEEGGREAAKESPSPAAVGSIEENGPPTSDGTEERPQESVSRDPVVAGLMEDLHQIILSMGECRSILRKASNGSGT